MTGILAIVVAVVAVGALHVLPPSDRLDPWRRTISEYALLDNGWVFNGAVLLIAAGSAGAVAALLLTGLLRPASFAFAGLALWSAGMVGVVVFPKHNWAVGPSMSGDLHRVASLVAFVALPIGAVALGRAWRRHEVWRRWAWATLALGVASMLAFSPLLYAIASAPFTGVRWWRVFPLGAVERALVLTEVATVLAIAAWAAVAGLRKDVRPEGGDASQRPAARAASQSSKRVAPSRAPLLGVSERSSSSAPK